MRKLFNFAILAALLTWSFYIVSRPSEGDLLQGIAQSSVQVNGSCTGTVVKPGIVLTAYHCIRTVGEKGIFIIRHGSNYSSMRFKSGRSADDYDMALLEGPEIGTPVKVSRSAPVPLKDHFVIGHPWGVLSQVVSFLVYSGTEPSPVGDFDLYSGAVAPGNSGSGIFTTSGRLVGVVLRAPRENSTFLLSVTYKKMHDFLEENGI